MNKTSFLLIFTLSFYSNLFSQDWIQQGSTFVKQDANIIYAVDTAISINDRDGIIDKTKAYIEKDLALLNEVDFNETVGIIFFYNRESLYESLGKRVSSYSILKDSVNRFSLIWTIFNQVNNPLNRELMKRIMSFQWGVQKDYRLTWLEEGLSTYASPEADGCNELNLEEKYTYLMQNEKLADVVQFPKGEITVDYKVARIQSAYLVSKLLDNYGIDKLKQLWIEGMDNFEKIYGISINAITRKINKELNKKYRKTIQQDWQTFIKDCINPQPDDWLPTYTNIPIFKGMFTKDDGNLKFMVSPTLHADKRNEAVVKTKEYIADNLSLIKESQFNDTLEVILVSNGEEMNKFYSDTLIRGMSSIATVENNVYIKRVYSTYDGNNPLKHELMHMVSRCKWGDDRTIQPEWLVEGLAVFANPETYSCDNHTFEERYVYFLQTGKLLTLEELMQFPRSEGTYSSKVAYNQSAYIVSVLYKKYEIEKIKKLWQNGMKNFEKIFGLTFEKMIENINSELSRKYPNPIEFNLEIFEKGCIE